MIMLTAFNGEIQEHFGKLTAFNGEIQEHFAARLIYTYRLAYLVSEGCKHDIGI